MTAALLRSVGQLLFGGVLVAIVYGGYMIVRDWRDQ